MDTLTIAGAVAGVTQFIKLVGEKFGFPIDGATTVIVAALVGVVLGFFNVEGTTVVTGFITAVATVGGFTAISKVRGK